MVNVSLYPQQGYILNRIGVYSFFVGKINYDR